MSDMCCKTCDHYSHGAASTCSLPLPWWAEPYDRPRVYGVEGEDCPQHSDFMEDMLAEREKAS